MSFHKTCKILKYGKVIKPLNILVRAVIAQRILKTWWPKCRVPLHEKRV